MASSKTSLISSQAEENTHMADLPAYPDKGGHTGDDTSVGPGRRAKPGMPRWVKVSLIIVIAVLVLLVVLMLTGVFGAGHDPGQFGPGRHVPGGGTPPSSP
jgi:hypothetical protein